MISAMKTPTQLLSILAYLSLISCDNRENAGGDTNRNTPAGAPSPANGSASGTSGSDAGTTSGSPATGTGSANP